jgi:mRNA interferase HigB
MHVVAKSTLSVYAARHPDSAASLAAWYRIASRADWGSMNDVIASFGKAKALNAERARFDIAGGEYRLIAAFNFRRGWAWIKFIGAHAEYDRVDALTVSRF